MPGVAVRLNRGQESSSGSASHRPAQLPPRKTIAPSLPASSPPDPEPSQAGGSGRRSSANGEEMVSAAAVYAAIRELQTAVTQLQNGQRVLLERTLPVPDMPSPPPHQSSALLGEHGTKTVTSAPLPSNPPRATSYFYTTRFSSLKIPVIPASLEELGTSKQFTDEELGIAPIPESERTSLTQLVEETLPEPAEVFTPEAPTSAGEPDLSPTQEEALSTAATAFTDPTPATSNLASEENQAMSQEDSLPPTSPFAYPLTPSTAREIENPFGGETADLTAPEKSNANSANAESTQAGVQADGSTKSPFFVTSEDDSTPPPTPPATSNLSKQIAAAKSIQSTKSENPFLEKRSREELWTEPKRSNTGVIVAVILALLTGLAAFLFLKSDLFSGGVFGSGDSEGGGKTTAPAPPLLELPAYGIALPEADPLVEEARAIALRFLDSKNAEDITPLISPVEPSLLEHFYEPLPAASVVRFYQGRRLPGERTEVDFLIKDYGRPERLLPLVKTGKASFLVDWQTFAECEELTLLSLAQGTLILAGEVVDEGSIRSFVQGEGDNGPSIDNENWQAFRLLNLTEEVEAYAVVRKDKPEFEELSSALANTQLKHNGAPAIRAILRVKSIDREDNESRQPARLEILDVISTTWRDGDSGEPAIAEPAPNKTEEAITPEPAPAEEKEEAAIDEPGDQLPPVPADIEPSAQEVD